MDDLVVDDTQEVTDAPTSAADAALAAMDMAPDVNTSVDSPVVDKPAEVVPGAEVKPDADPLAKVVEKKPLEVKAITDEDLQRPENLSHKARDRFEKLVNGYKAEKTRADTVETELTQHRESFKALQELGFNDEASGRDLIEFAKFRQALSSSPKDALQTLQGMMRQIELQTGLRANNTSALESFPDLVEAVNGEKLDYSHALEVARARQAQAEQQQQNQQYQQRQQQTFQSQQAMEQSISSVEQLEAKWRSTNPDYAAIHPHIQAEMQVIAKQFPPTQWPQQVELLYNSLSRAMSSQARPNVGQPTPLRGNGHAASRAAPKSAAEAALMALGMDV